MADTQLPGQIEPIADGSRLTTPLWFQWFTFLQKTLVTLQTTVTTIQNTITTLLGAWNSSFTPVLTADAGGPPIGTKTCRYRRLGKTVDVQLKVSITNINGSSGALYITLPVGPAIRDSFLAGGETSLTGYAIRASIFTGETKCSVAYYDNTSVLTDGTALVLTGTYEV
jgi:hypothetical protein